MAVTAEAPAALVRDLRLTTAALVAAAAAVIKMANMECLVAWTTGFEEIQAEATLRELAQLL